LLFLAGVIVAAWPDKEAEPVTVKVGARRAQQPSAAD
jgi:hypothetical protein